MTSTIKVSRAELVGVFGDPVDENPTGLMQEAAFRALGLDWRYITMRVEAGDLQAAVAGLRVMNFKGINLTIPHKVAVLQHLDRVAEDAAIMGAVNTVRREGALLIGENTDGKGFLRSIREDAGVDSRGKRVVFIGAGGAARAMSVEMALKGAAHITIVNRTAARGQALAKLLQEHTRTQVDFVLANGDYLVPANTDILVNATSIGLYPNVSEMPPVDMDSIRAGLLVCDVIPNPPRTAFLRAAEKCGARTLDGLGMLVYQGAIAFKMWTGQDAPVAVMRQTLQEVFGAV